MDESFWTLCKILWEKEEMPVTKMEMEKFYKYQMKKKWKELTKTTIIFKWLYNKLYCIVYHSPRNHQYNSERRVKNSL